MKRLGGTFVFCGIVLIVGPFFGITVRGAGDFDYGSGVVLGLVSLGIGAALTYFGKGAKK